MEDSNIGMGVCQSEDIYRERVLKANSCPKFEVVYYCLKNMMMIF